MFSFARRVKAVKCSNCPGTFPFRTGIINMNVSLGLRDALLSGDYRINHAELTTSDSCLGSHIRIIIFPYGRESFLNSLWGCPAKNIVRTAGFVVCARHSTATERLLANH